MHVRLGHRILKSVSLMVMWWQEDTASVVGVGTPKRMPPSVVQTPRDAQVVYGALSYCAESLAAPKWET
jgi:hypothetical protein